MLRSIEDYDIYPKVFPINKEVKITVKPIFKKDVFGTGEKTIKVLAIDGGSPNFKFNMWNEKVYSAAPLDNGVISFNAEFDHECEYFVRIYDGNRMIIQLSVYALEEDLSNRIPLRGDLHMHTIRSDGSQAPGIVAANYRSKGYDFLAITDHHRYYPSLEAMNDYKGIPTDYALVPGEEVHLPLTDTHIVNFGGEFSVNGLIKSSPNYTETDGKLDSRSLYGTAPETYERDEFENMIKERASKKSFPEGVEPDSFETCLWIFEKIREAGGLGIFAHPYWVSDVFQVPEKYTNYMLETHPFDAFEVLGGERYYAQNGLQTACYYEQYRRGNILPIVGSTDSHSSLDDNVKGFICSTIVFAPENERCSIIKSIKEKYSVAIDTISAEYRIVGELRYQKYARFLLDNWFPIHDMVTEAEGRLMKDYYLGNDPAETLEALKLYARKLESMRKKYFAFN